jgi:hypothetical protein
VHRALEAADPAKAAGSGTCACGGHGDAIGIEDIEQLEIGRARDAPPAIDGNGHRARRQQDLPGAMQYECQRDQQQGKEKEPEQDVDHITRTPTKAEKAIDMSPVTMNAIPSPSRPLGISA